MSEEGKRRFEELENLFVYQTNESCVYESFLNGEFNLKNEVKMELLLEVTYPIEFGIGWFQDFLKENKVGDEYETYDGETFTLEQHHIEYVENKLKTFKSVYNLITPIVEELKHQIEFEAKMDGKEL